MYFLLVQSINFTNTVSQFTGYVVDSLMKNVYSTYSICFCTKKILYILVLKTIISVD